MTNIKRIAVLGSTGSVGRQALDVAEREGHKVTVLSARSDGVTIEEQARKFKPEFCILDDHKAAADLKTSLADTGITVLEGISGLRYALNSVQTDVAVNAVGGASGLMPTLEILKTTNRLALANKESLVIAGSHVMELASRLERELLPVDSEHCALFQCLCGQDKSKVRRLILTASGGPFYGKAPSELETITPSQALAHPTWKMGRKITVDSATLMNKGFEVIEAAHLFGVTADAINVVIQRESIIHSMVEYADNSIIAQMSVPDMRLCVQYAINYPVRMPPVIPPLDLTQIATLSFAKPDMSSFPLLGLAFDCLRGGGAMPAVLNAANEVAVQAFLDLRIGFCDISRLVSNVLEKMSDAHKASALDEILDCDIRARRYTSELIG